MRIGIGEEPNDTVGLNDLGPFLLMPLCNAETRPRPVTCSPHGIQPTMGTAFAASVR